MKCIVIETNFTIPEAEIGAISTLKSKSAGCVRSVSWALSRDFVNQQGAVHSSEACCMPLSHLFHICNAYRVI